MRKIFKNRTLPSTIEYKKPSPTDVNFLSPYHYTPSEDLEAIDVVAGDIEITAIQNMIATNIQDALEELKSRSYFEIGFTSTIDSFIIPNTGTNTAITGETYLDDNKLLSGFASETPGIVVNDTGRTIFGKVTLVISALNTCSDSINYTIRIRKNNSVYRQVPGSVPGETKTSVVIQGIVQLEDGDDLRASASATSGTACDGFAITDYSLIFEEIQ